MQKLITTILNLGGLIIILLFATPIHAQSITCHTANNGMLYISAEQCQNLGGEIINTPPPAGANSDIYCYIPSTGEHQIVATEQACIDLRNNPPAQTQQTQQTQQIADPSLSPLPGLNKDANISEYIKAIYNYGIGIVGILATVVIMIGGLIWITSMGNAQRVSSAKEWISAALTGLALAMFSYTLLWIINPDLVKFSDLNVPTVGENNIPSDSVLNPDYCQTATNYSSCGPGQTRLCMNGQCMECVQAGDSCTNAPCCAGSGRIGESNCVNGICWENPCQSLNHYDLCSPRNGGNGYCDERGFCVYQFEDGHSCVRANQCLGGTCTPRINGESVCSGL